MEQKLTTACRVVPMMINNRELENLRQFRMPKLPPSPSNSFGLHRVMRWRPWNERYADIRPRDYTATVVINHRNGWDHYCSTISWPCFYTLRCRVIYSTCWRSLEEENQVAISRKSVTVYQKDRNARFLSTSQICMEKSYQHLRMFGRPLFVFFWSEEQGRLVNP